LLRNNQLLSKEYPLMSESKKIKVTKGFFFLKGGEGEKERQQRMESDSEILGGG
jgi:hypothetical protein